MHPPPKYIVGDIIATDYGTASGGDRTPAPES